MELVVLMSNRTVGLNKLLGTTKQRVSILNLHHIFFFLLVIIFYN